VKYAFIVRHRDVWSTRAMCRAMNVSTSGFYEWFGRPISEQSQTDARLTRSIRQSFELSDGTYGSPRVWHDLRAAGEHCGINRVARLMKLANLQARRKRRRLPGDTAASRLENHIAPNHLQREFQALELNQKLVADSTYIWTAEGWLYAAAVMDLYGKLLLDLENGALRSQDLPNQGTGQNRCIQLHRAVLQPVQKTLKIELPQPGSIRGATALKGLGKPSGKLGEAHNELFVIGFLQG